MAVEWGKQLETGIPSLDTEHQDIIQCINAFFDKCDEGGGVDEIDELYDSLDGYTKRHFSYEENLQKYNNYPGLKEQQNQHALFLAELGELKETLAASGPSRKLTITTKGKLIRWLNHHINSLDREFVDFLKTKQG
jgi:hemerythrin-like metal-binding protein